MTFLKTSQRSSANGPAASADRPAYQSPDRTAMTRSQPTQCLGGVGQAATVGDDSGSTCAEQVSGRGRLGAADYPHSSSRSCVEGSPANYVRVTRRKLHAVTSGDIAMQIWACHRLQLHTGPDRCASPTVLVALSGAVMLQRGGSTFCEGARLAGSGRPLRASADRSVCGAGNPGCLTVDEIDPCVHISRLASATRA